MTKICHGALVASLLLFDAGTASAASPATPFVLDLSGDGIALGGDTTTSLFGPPVRVRWTKPTTDDAFMALNATALRSKGYDMKNAAGIQLAGVQLVRGGVRLRGPNAADVAVSDPWQLLSLLDANADGKLTVADPPWSIFSLFVDTGANGKIDSGELMDFASAGIASLSLAHGARTTDIHGNTLASGSYQTASGSTRVAAGVTLASLAYVPAKPPNPAFSALTTGRRAPCAWP